MRRPICTGAPGLSHDDHSTAGSASITITVEPMLNRPISRPCSSTISRPSVAFDERLAAARRSHHAAPCELDAPHEDRPDHGDRQRSEIGVEERDDPLVAGEQSVDRVDGHRVHAEQIARHVHRGAETTGDRHVHAVIVARGQVDGREPPAAELGRGAFIAPEERLQGVGAVLGLDDAPAVHRACGRDGPVGRRDDGAGSALQRPRAGGQRAGEERVEVGIGRGGRVRDDAQIDPVPAGEPADLPVLPRSEPDAGRAKHHPRQQVLRIEPLAHPGEAVGSARPPGPVPSLACQGGDSSTSGKSPGNREGAGLYVRRPGRPGPPGTARGGRICHGQPSSSITAISAGRNRPNPASDARSTS